MNRKRLLFFMGLVLIGILLLLLGRCDREGNDRADFHDGPTLKFETVSELQIARFYDQRTPVLLTNEGDTAVVVRVGSSPPSDLAAGFVGRGSHDFYDGTDAEIGPGETWPFLFVIHANRARKSGYTIPVAAFTETADGKWKSVAEGSVPIVVAKPKLELEFSWHEGESPSDQGRLVRYLTVKNVGTEVPDLSIVSNDALDGRVILYPEVEERILGGNESVEIRMRPHLFHGFSELKGALLLTGHNQQVEVPYEVSVPAGKEVFLSITKSTSVGASSGQRCTNSKSAGYGMPATRGTQSGYEGNGGVGGGGASDGGGGLSVATGGKGKKPIEDAEEDIESEEGDEEMATSLTGWLNEAERNKENTGIADNANGATKGTKGTTSPEAFDGGELSPEDIEEAIAGLDGKLPNTALEHVIPRVIEDGDIEAMKLFESLPKLERLLRSNGWTMEDMKDPRKRRQIVKQWLASRDPLVASSDDLRRRAMELYDLVNRRGGKEVAVNRRGDQADMVVKRTHRGKSSLDYIPINGPSRKLRAPVAIADWGKVIGNPTLSRDPEGNPLAGFSQENDQGGSDIVVASPESGERVSLGDPALKSTKPAIVPGEDMTDVVWMEEGKIKKASLVGGIGGGGPASAAGTVAEGADPYGPLVARRGADGNLATMFRRGGELVLDQEGRDEIRTPGQSGDFAFDQAGAPRVVYQRGDGAIVERLNDDGESEPLVPTEWRTGPPALVETTDGGLRMSVHRPPSSAPPGESGGSYFREFKDGEWGELKLNIQPDEPVTGAVAVVNFSLPWDEAHLKTMTTKVRVNGTLVGEIKDRIPNGRYAFAIPPGVLKHRHGMSDKVEENRIEMSFEGTGPGHFHVSDHAAIYTRHEIIQDFVVAKDRAEADHVAYLMTPEVRHEVFDLVLTSDFWELPKDAVPGSAFTAEIGLLNVGDMPSPAGTMVAKHGEQELGRVDFQALDAFHRREVSLPIKLPQDWDADEPFVFTIRAPIEGDAEPANNRLTYGILGEPNPQLSGPDGPVRINPRVLALDGVETLDPGKKTEIGGENGRGWYKIAVEETGKLELELEGVDLGMSIVVDLFDEEGKVIDPSNSVWKTSGGWIYLRVGTRPGEWIAPGAKIKIWWEQ